jgi:hypothetical protein
MGQGQSEAPTLNPLVERQGPGRTTSDGTPGAKNAWRGRSNLDPAQSESTSHPSIATQGVSSPAAEAGVHPQKFRQDASSLDSLPEGPSHASLVPAGSGAHCSSDQ